MADSVSDSVLPSASTFDLAAALLGRGYPEIEVPFFLDEAAALELARAERELTRLALLGRTDEHDALEKTVDQLRAALRSQQYTYHLKGIPNKTRRDILAKAFEKYPRQKNLLGMEEDNDDRDGYFTSLLWQAMTVKITAPDGAVQVNPSLEAIEQFRDFAPTATLDAIGAGIQELTTGVKAGFEAAVQETDFLSQP